MQVSPSCYIVLKVFQIFCKQTNKQYSLFNEGDLINPKSYLTYGLRQPDGIDWESILRREETGVSGENPRSQVDID